jgi:triphosphoribosyl-dephospho-CoA synthetase
MRSLGSVRANVGWVDRKETARDHEALCRARRIAAQDRRLRHGP